MDTAHWPQGIVVKPIEEIVTNTCPKPGGGAIGGGGGGGPNGNLTGERKARPQKEQALNCPRCNSTNTKFCYYNNYSLTQPRYFCKTCRRYWTEGGSLRNIPVGGGSRKNKRSSSSSSISTSSAAAATAGGNNNSISTTSNNNSSSSSASKRLPDLIQTQGQDLNLTFPSSTTSHQDFRNIISDHLIHHHHNPINDQNKQNSHIISDDNSTTTATTTTSHLSALELLTGLTSRGLNSFMPMPPGTDPTTTATSNNNNNHNNLGFPIPMQDFKPTLNFSLDGLGVGSGYGGLQVQGHVQESGGRLLFPFEDLKQNGGGIDHHHHHHHHQSKDHGDSTGYWTGMLGGGSW